MANAKLYFSVLLVIVASFLLWGSFNKMELSKVNVFDIGKNILKGEIKEYSLEDAKTYSCTVESLMNRTIILRIDDVARWNDLFLMKNMVNEIVNRGYGVSLGLIPHRLEEDYDLIRWLQKIKENSNVELSQHGYDHSNQEFVSLNYDEATKTINLGKDIMIRLFGEIPINFIPPYNVESQDTMKALKDSGFKTFSGDHNKYSVKDGFAVAGFTSTTYIYSENRFIYSNEVLENCKNSLDKNGVCVIMFHPQDFTSDGEIDSEEYAEFIKVLNGLKNLNAQVVNFRQAFCKEY